MGKYWVPGGPPGVTAGDVGGAVTIENMEKERLATNVRIVNDLILTLQHFGWLPKNYRSPLKNLEERKKHKKILPISEAVRAAEVFQQRGKDEVQIAKSLKGHERRLLICKAIGHLVEALLSCWPWTTSHLIMSIEEAYERGLSQV